MGKIVNQTELAEIHGVSDVTIWTWQKEGLPVEKINTRGLSNEYDTASTIEWRVNRAEKKVRDESPRDALARAQTQLALQTFAEKERSLVPAAEVEAEFSRLVVQARVSLLQIPGLLQAQLDEAQRTTLKEHLEKVLKELSHYDPIARTGEAGGSEVGAASEALAGGMGGGQAAP